MNEDRLVEIESKLAFQDYTIKNLNDVILEQQKTIDRLENKTESLKERVEEMMGDMSHMKIRDEKPPHY